MASLNRTCTGTHPAPLPRHDPVNGYVPMRESGIPWLGEIPAHWEVRKLHHCIDVLTGFAFPSSGFVQEQSAHRLLRGINVTPRGIRWQSVVRWNRTPTDGLSRFALNIGDVVLGMDRPIISQGIRAVSVEAIDTPSLLLQRVARIRTNHSLVSHYLLLLFRGRLFSAYIAPLFTGVSVPHLSSAQIRSFPIPLPPLSEQAAIVAHLDGATRDLDATIARTQRQVDLLREYRTRLVADVVTGKVDVRALAATLPDEPPDDDDFATLDDDTPDDDDPGVDPGDG